MKPRVEGDPDPPTDRQRLEAEQQIRPACVTCHSTIDPLGNALGNFDATGRWQSEEWGKPVDAAVTLVNGTKVNGVAGLRGALVGHSDQFVQAFTERLLVYALGRSIDRRDMPAVRSIARDAGRQNNRFSAIILAIVKSPTFQVSRRPGNAG
ncbi:MAG TPA: DUF1585 domain-containing protein [Terriglobia bacterium]|nr:DUF1585 domain-containing protein [Terriglobia bacterium]